MSSARDANSLVKAVPVEVSLSTTASARFDSVVTMFSPTLVMRLVIISLALPRFLSRSSPLSESTLIKDSPVRPSVVAMLPVFESIA